MISSLLQQNLEKMPKGFLYIFTPREFLRYLIFIARQIRLMALIMPNIYLMYLMRLRTPSPFCSYPFSRGHLWEEIVKVHQQKINWCSNYLYVGDHTIKIHTHCFGFVIPILWPRNPGIVKYVFVVNCFKSWQCTMKHQ